MPFARATLALELAATLSNSVPATIEDLCHDLTTRLAALLNAVDELLEMGVHVSVTPDGWLIDHPASWRQAQRLGYAYWDTRADAASDLAVQERA